MPNQPRVFIGSSSESSNVVFVIDSHLQRANCIPSAWHGNFRGSHNTLSELFRAVKNHDFAIFLFTPEDVIISRDTTSKTVRDNVIFEFGMFMGVLGQDRTYAIAPHGVDLKVMSDLQGIKIHYYNHPPKNDPNSNFQAKLRGALGDVCAEIVEDIRNVGMTTLSGNADNVSKKIAETISGLGSIRAVVGNPCLQHIVLTSLQNLAMEVNSIKTQFALPGSSYPPLLISLQDQLKPTIVKAVALVDQKERFWRQEQGKKILLSSDHSSERIFVFIDPDSFSETWPELQRHADRYNVYAMSYAHLVQLSPHHRDFSLLSHEQKQLVAYYDSNTPPNIVFSVNEEEIKDYEKEYDRIKKSAQPIKFIEDVRQSEEALEELRVRIFTQTLRYDHKPVEMSRYLSIDLYDKFEEVHPFRAEMIEKMLAMFNERCAELERTRGRKQTEWRILEFGAGTGLFTARLANIPNTFITAVEYDNACYNKLEHAVRQHRHVICMEQDSRSFDPGGETKKYDFVFSCFADHHIPDADKLKYLANVKANLESDGRFIIGEEFIGPCRIDIERERNDPSLKRERDQSIETYHKCIIDLAKQDPKTTQEEKDGIVYLETKAMESGLQRWEKGKGGDYKVPEDYYRRLLEKAGFSTQFIKFGPLNSDIGGVYAVSSSIRP